LLAAAIQESARQAAGLTAQSINSRKTERPEITAVGRAVISGRIFESKIDNREAEKARRIHIPLDYFGSIVAGNSVPELIAIYRCVAELV
jgi:hypothetical protein